MAAELQLRQFLTRSLTTNLTQAYADWLPGAAYREATPDAPPDDLPPEERALIRYVFEGEDIAGPNGPSDSLSFTTVAPIVGNVGLPGMLKQVTYEILAGESDYDLASGEGTDGPATYTLEVTETPIMGTGDGADSESIGGDEPPTAQGLSENAEDAGRDSPGWSVPIRTMNIQYFDGEQWVDDWNSITKGRLPWAVDIRINFARAAAELEAERIEQYDLHKDADFRLVIPLPAGSGITDMPPDYVRPSGARPGDAI